MTYQRVIPRDLFNEANLLKCYGKLWLLLEKLNLPHVKFELEGDTFEIEQGWEDGHTYIDNLKLMVGHPYATWHPLSRPLNSRDAWPLYVTHYDRDDIAVFTDTGELTEEFLSLLQE